MAFNTGIRSVFARGGERVFSVFFALCLAACTTLCGCSMVRKIQYLPQLLTLKGYSESQADIRRAAERQDGLFDEMLAEIEAGLFEYQTADEVKRRFGPPVFARQYGSEEEGGTEWLYRRVKDFGGEKVRLYFDDDMNLTESVYEQPRAVCAAEEE